MLGQPLTHYFVSILIPGTVFELQIQKFEKPSSFLIWGIFLPLYLPGNVVDWRIFAIITENFI